MYGGTSQNAKKSSALTRLFLVSRLSRWWWKIIYLICTYATLFVSSFNFSPSDPTSLAMFSASLRSFPHPSLSFERSSRWSPSALTSAISFQLFWVISFVFATMPLLLETVSHRFLIMRYVFCKISTIIIAFFWKSKWPIWLDKFIE